MLRKWRYWVIGVMFAISIVATTTVIFINFRHKVKQPTEQFTKLPTIQDLRKNNAALSKEAGGQADVAIARSSLDAKQYQTAIKQSQAVYQDNKLTVATRVQAYSICIEAAIANNKDTNTANSCKDSALKLLDDTTGLSPEEVTYYKFEIKFALGEAKASDFGGSNAGR